MDEDKKNEIVEWFEFRISHLKERHARGDENAYVRLTEVEAMKDFFERLFSK